ncbi:MAG TPA: BON domain-containing protein [Steroidobacteraceae bacterium]|nr:BON domain-containing protein [Steroidobacteraceae bacterium]
MKKTPTLTAAVACSLAALAPFAVLATAAASDMDGMQPTLVIKDSSITSSIRAQLASDSLKGLSHIDVDTDHHGVVTLKGKVPTQDAADRAISIARATDGVRTVKSALKVKIDD